MKITYAAGGAILVLLSVLIIGFAGAGTLDAPVRDIYWNVGTAGFTAGTYERYVDTVQLTVPAGGYLEYIAPLTVPSSLNGKPCSVNRVYLYLSAPSQVRLGWVEPKTGGQSFTVLSPDIPGTASNQMISLSLGESYAVPRGLVTMYEFHNTGTIPASVTIYGYGARISHAG